VKPQPRRDTRPEQKDLHLAELLDFRPDQGIIRLHEQHCMAIGRDAESWGADLEAIRADFPAATVGQEVERLHEAVSKRHRLSKPSC